MPLKKAKGMGSKAIKKAVAYNVSELKAANKSKPKGKKRSTKQIVAIAYSAAKK